jgi:hypothetical protein
VRGKRAPNLTVEILSRFNLLPPPLMLPLPSQARLPPSCPLCLSFVSVCNRQGSDSSFVVVSSSPLSPPPTSTSAELRVIHAKPLRRARLMTCNPIQAGGSPIYLASRGQSEQEDPERRPIHVAFRIPPSLSLQSRGGCLMCTFFLSPSSLHMYSISQVIYLELHGPASAVIVLCLARGDN